MELCPETPHKQQARLHLLPASSPAQDLAHCQEASTTAKRGRGRPLWFCTHAWLQLWQWDRADTSSNATCRKVWQYLMPAACSVRGTAGGQDGSAPCPNLAIVTVIIVMVIIIAYTPPTCSSGRGTIGNQAGLLPAHLRRRRPSHWEGSWLPGSLHCSRARLLGHPEWAWHGDCDGRAAD